MEDNTEDCPTCSPGGLKFSRHNGRGRVEVPEDFLAHKLGSIDAQIAEGMAMAERLAAARQRRDSAPATRPSESYQPQEPSALTRPAGNFIFDALTMTAETQQGAPSGENRRPRNNQFTLAETEHASLLGMGPPPGPPTTIQFTLAESGAADVFPALTQAAEDGNAEEKRLKKEVEDAEYQLEYWLKELEKCEAACRSKLGAGAANSQIVKCMLDDPNCRFNVNAVIRSRESLAKAKAALQEWIQGEADKAKPDATGLGSDEWKKWGADLLENLKDGLSALDDDDVDGYMKDKGKGLLTDQAKQAIKDKTGWDPDTKPACVVAGMMLVAYALKAGTAGTSTPQHAAADAYIALKDDPSFKVANAACRALSKEAKSTDATDFCTAWLEWAASQEK